MGDGRIPHQAAEGFQAGAEDYERARPSYPAEAVAHLVGHTGLGPGRRLLDLAAGTGKLTRLLVPTGADVVAVEPVAGMREQLVAVLPDVVALDGTAEDIPAEDAAFDVLTAAQAVHWFDLPVALPEMARVLRPGGSLAVVFNVMDETVDWVRAYHRAIDTGRGLPFRRYVETDFGDAISEVGGGRFTDLQRYECRWTLPYDTEMLVDRAASVSVVASLEPEEKQGVLDDVRRLAATHPDLAGRPVIGFPYTTRVLRWTRS